MGGLEAIILRVKLKERKILPRLLPKVEVQHQFPMFGRSCPVTALLGVEILDREGLVKPAKGKTRANSR
jgi:hypothetical protein